MESMHGFWAAALVVAVTLVLALWSQYLTIGAFAVFLTGLLWGPAAGVGAVVLLAGGYLLETRDPHAVLLDAAVILPLALGGSFFKRRSDEQRRRWSRLRSSFQAVLSASQKAISSEDPNEPLQHFRRFLEESFAGKVELLSLHDGRIVSEEGTCGSGNWLPHQLRALEMRRVVDLGIDGRHHRYLAPLCTQNLLCIETEQPLDPDEQVLIESFADLICLVRKRLQESRDAKQFGYLMTALASSDSLSEASEKVIQLLLPVLNASSGLVVIFRGGWFETLAMVGNIPESERKLLESGLPAGWGGIWRSYIQRRPLFVDDYGTFDLKVDSIYEAGIRSVAFLPVAGERRGRIVLVVQDHKPRTWSEADRDFLANVARALGLMAEQFLTRERMNALLRLEREVFGSSVEQAYDILLDFAVRLVPGGEAGSLLVRTSEDEFRYTSAVGYDQEELREIRYSLAGVRDQWYGAGDGAWQRGEPRILSAVERDIAEASYKTAPIEVIDQAGRVREIKANLCLPIVYQREVLALLNIDSFSDPEAFDVESIESARFFAQQAALLLHEQHLRNLLERAAGTDPLTGLANRRAFEQDLQDAWQAAERYGYSLAVLIMDLSHFKEINDRYGHAAGDEVLVRVGRVMREHSRHGDGVYRWGGDEFAVLMPHTNLLGAVRAAERYAHAIEQVCVKDVCVGVNIGAASLPEDTRNPAELVKLADARMYQAKRAGLIVEPRS